MISYRTVFAICSGCIAVIGLLVSAQIAKEMRYIAQAPPSPSSSERSQPLTTDHSFYEREAPAVPALPAPATPAPGPVAVSAQAYLVGDIESGQVYLERNSYVPLPIASMSKLMTAIVATNSISPTTTIAITEPEASVYPDQSNLKAGEQFTRQELLYPLLLSSSNVAAEALASTTNRSEFLNQLNGYSWEIGLPKSYFADPSGLSPQNAASARGFFALSRYLYRSRPDILAITRISTTSVATTTDHGAHTFANIHPFVHDPRYIGGKTGHTPEAGDTMLTLLRLDGRAVAFVVLGSGDRQRDTSLLLSLVQKTLASR